MKKIIIVIVVFAALAYGASHFLITSTNTDIESRSITDVIGVEKTGKRSVVYYTAKWCRPCKSFKPIYDELQQDFSDVVFYTIDIDSVKVKIAVPTLIVFNKEGMSVAEKTGHAPMDFKSKYIKLIKLSE